MPQISSRFCVVRLGDLFDLHGIVDNQVHEFVEATDNANDADRELLVEPDLDWCSLLQEFEKKVDWWEQNPATTTSSSSSHCVV